MLTITLTASTEADARRLLSALASAFGEATPPMDAPVLTATPVAPSVAKRPGRPRKDTPAATAPAAPEPVPAAPEPAPAPTEQPSEPTPPLPPPVVAGAVLGDDQNRFNEVMNAVTATTKRLGTSGAVKVLQYIRGSAPSIRELPVGDVAGFLAGLDRLA